MKGAAFLFFVLLAPGAAAAADPGYCQLYAREATRIGVASAAEEDLKTVAPDLPTVIKYSLTRNYSICLNADQDPALPTTPLASDSAWVEMVARNVHDKLGSNNGPEPIAAARVSTAPPAAAEHVVDVNKVIEKPAPGTVPATDAPAPAPAVVAYPPAAPAEPAKVAASKYSAADLAECRRQFRSFDPTTLTVIEFHHRRRQLCPILR